MSSPPVRALSAEQLTAAFDSDDFRALVVRRARSPSVSSVDSSVSVASCASCGSRRHRGASATGRRRASASALALPGRPGRSRRPRPERAPAESSGLVATVIGACTFVASLGLLQIYLLAVVLFRKLRPSWL